MYHLSGYKAKLKKYRKVEIIPSLLCKKMKEDYKTIQKPRTHTKLWRLYSK